DRIRYSTVDVDIERDNRIVTITIRGPEAAPPKDPDALVNLGADYWPLRCARELDDAILHLRLNELATAVIVFKTLGDPKAVIAHDEFLAQHAENWLAREILGLWKRV